MIKKLKINETFIKLGISLILFIVSLVLKSRPTLSFILILLSYIVTSYEIYIDAIKNIFKGEFFDENLLMIIATIGAFCIGEYTEAVMVMLLFEFGEYLSDMAVDNSKDSITKLMDLRSDSAYLKDGGKVDIKEVKIGDIFIVKPGEKIPLDGTVVSGESSIDTSSLTGEFIPKRALKGDEVLSGTINLDSIIEVKATSEFETSTASRIIDLIENSNENKTNTEKFITRFSKIYTPIVVLLAVAIVLIPTLLGGNFNEWLYKGLEFLVISCPCALIISVPLGFFCGIGRASKEGILIKGSNELDHLSSIKAIVFDKTGTLTHGNFEVDKICSSGKVKEDELLKIAACAESYSNHPIAKSILRKYDKDIDKGIVKDYKEVSGNGIECKIDGKNVYVGNEKLLLAHNIEVQKHESEVGTTVYIGKENEYLGHIIITDIIKKEAYELVENLSGIGINKVVMLSGDDIKIVEKVGKSVNINEYYANLLPEDKVNKLNDIKNDYFTAFVGDGINDAPVIKLSDLGIAMGGIGSDSAIEAADIVLMKDDLNNIPKAVKISRVTKRIIKFNIAFAILFKVCMLILASFGIAKIWMAVFADVGVTLLSVLNTLRIMKKKI